MDAVIELKKKLTEQGLKGLALDIDQTLADTRPHWMDHLMRFHTPENMTREQLEEHKFLEHVPAWQTEEAKEFIAKTMESNEFNETIPLLHESSVMVQKLNAIMPIVAYISARPDSVLHGTERWLKRHGFPLAPVILRPGQPGHHGLETKNTWKAAVLRELYPFVQGIVDDHVDLPEALAQVGYKGKVFVYGPQSKEIKPDAYQFPVIVSPSWDHVLDHFQP